MQYVVVRIPPPRFDERGHLGRQVVMARHHTFCPARGAARVEDHRPPERLDIRQRRPTRHDAADGLLHVQDLGTRSSREIRGCDFERGIAHDRPRTAVPHHVRQLRQGVIGAQGDGDAPRPPDPPQHRHVVHSRLNQKGNRGLEEIRSLSEQRIRDSRRSAQKVSVRVGAGPVDDGRPALEEGRPLDDRQARFRVGSVAHLRANAR